MITQRTAGRGPHVSNHGGLEGEGVSNFYVDSKKLSSCRLSELFKLMKVHDYIYYSLFCHNNYEYVTIIAKLC